MDDPRGRMPGILFALLLSMCVVVAITFTVDEPAGGHGAPHPIYETMERAASGVDRHAPVMGLAWLFGILQIALFVCCLRFAIGGACNRPALTWTFLIGGLLYGAAFTWMIVSYGQYMRAEAPALVLGFPAPTALMLFCLWPAPLFFMVVYYATFHRWVMTDDDMERFRRIVARARSTEQDAD